MKKIIYTLTALLLVSCGTTKLLAPSQTDVDRGAKNNPDITMVTLNEGKSIVETECTKCHGLKNPRKFSVEEWNSIVPKMAGKANKKAGTEVIDARKKDLILQYVTTMAQK